MEACGERLIALALRADAAKAAMLAGTQIKLLREFRAICESNGCGNYGKCWMCPPDVGEIDALMARVRAYPHALIYQTVGQLEDSFDVEGMTRCAAEHAQVSRRLGELAAPLLPKGILHLSCGGCRLCEVCARREGAPCRHPLQALPSLESCGVDVYNTVKDTNLKYINGQNTVTFFGAVLFGA